MGAAAIDQNVVACIQKRVHVHATTFWSIVAVPIVVLN